MKVDPLATPCGLYCGFCRYYMNQGCKGCDGPERKDCEIRRCVSEKRIRFCTECEDFACSKCSGSLHPDWLKDLESQPLPKRGQG